MKMNMNLKYDFINEYYLIILIIIIFNIYKKNISKIIFHYISHFFCYFI